MMSKFFAIFVFSIVMILYAPSFYLLVQAQTAQDLNSLVTTPSIHVLIQEKSVELQKLQQQRDAFQRELDVIEKSKQGLSKEINLYDNSIKQVNLSIKSNTLQLEKLRLEIDELRDGSIIIGESIDRTQDVLRKLFVELQQRERDDALSIILRNRNLSDSVSEFQSLTLLNSQLSDNITEFRALQQALTQSLDVAQEKKQIVQVETINLSSRQKIVEEQKQEKQTLLNSTKNQEKVYQQQISEIEKQQAEISAFVEEIESELRRNINPNLLPLPRPGILQWPVPGGVETQGYGQTAFALRNYKGKFHNAIDIGGVPVGTPIVSAEKGMVISIGDQDRFCYKAAYGKFVVVKHENGLTTLYAHLSKINVSIGDSVERGSVIGYLGRTGFATGPHLHFTVFASATITPAKPGLPEGTQSSSCGPMPVGGHLDPKKYL